jgi:hypothetical protein
VTVYSDMGGARSTHGRDQKLIHYFIQKKRTGRDILGHLGVYGSVILKLILPEFGAEWIDLATGKVKLPLCLTKYHTKIHTHF